MADSSHDLRTTDNQRTPQTDSGVVTDNLANLGDLPELRIYSHSTIFYWWPVWTAGYIMAAITMVGGQKVAFPNGTEVLIYPHTSLGLTFLVVLTLVMIFTNVKMRGMYSVMFLLTIGFFIVLFGWLGLLDKIFSWIPNLSVFMNVGFYLTFSTLLLAIWLLRFVVFDRLTFWRVRPGQLTLERVVGGGEQSYDTRGMLFEQRGDDFFRHIIVGLGSGDLRLITTGAKKAEIDIPNVLFARRKVDLIQRLIATKPDDILSQEAPVHSVN